MTGKSVKSLTALTTASMPKGMTRLNPTLYAPMPSTEHVFFTIFFSSSKLSTSHAGITDLFLLTIIPFPCPLPLQQDFFLFLADIFYFNSHVNKSDKFG